MAKALTEKTIIAAIKGITNTEILERIAEAAKGHHEATVAAENKVNEIMNGEMDPMVRELLAQKFGGTDGRTSSRRSSGTPRGCVNPNNHEEVYGGRGKPPVWYSNLSDEQKEAGKALFLAQNTVATEEATEENASTESAGSGE